jgi:hypothetical protein
MEITSNTEFEEAQKQGRLWVHGRKESRLDLRTSSFSKPAKRISRKSTFILLTDDAA